MSSEVLSVIEGVLQPMIVVNTSDRIVALNSSASALFGTGCVGRHYITALRQPALLDCIERVEGGREKTAETEFLTTRDGRDMSYRVTATWIEMGDDAVTTVCFSDTTELDQIDVIRTEFVANVSHELRTPLTALLGFVETLRGPARNDPAAQERFLGIMEAEASRMNRLVSDLLSLSQLEAAKRRRPSSQVQLAPVIRTSVTLLDPMARERGARISFEIAPGAEDVAVSGDSDQLAQVVANLLENALKYGGSENRVTITLARHDHHAELRGPAVSIAVADTGPGFDPVHIPRLTERFYRIDSHRSRALGGTGLGLAIVKHILQRHRGRLRIASTPGKGAHFVALLPLD